MSLCSFIGLERPAVSCFRGKFKAPFIIQNTICGADERFGCPPTTEQTQHKPVRPPLWLCSARAHEVAVCLLWSQTRAAAQPPRILTASSALYPNRPLDPQTPQWDRTVLEHCTLAASTESFLEEEQLLKQRMLCDSLSLCVYLLTIFMFIARHTKNIYIFLKHLAWAHSNDLSDFVQLWFATKEHLAQISHLRVFSTEQVSSQMVILHSNLKTTFPDINWVDLCDIMKYKLFVWIGLFMTAVFTVGSLKH